MRATLRFASVALLLAAPAARAAETPRTGPPSWHLANIGDGKLLEIRLRTGAALRIVGIDGDEATVTTDWTEDRCPDAEFEVTPSVDGIRVETQYPPGAEVVTHNCSFSVTIRVPRRFDVRLSSAGGSVAISGLRGQIGGHTGGGKIELRDLNGTVELRTGGGAIVVQDCNLEGRLSTGGGRVTFDNVSGGVTGRTGSRRGIVRGAGRLIKT